LIWFVEVVKFAVLGISVCWGGGGGGGGGGSGESELDIPQVIFPKLLKYL